MVTIGGCPLACNPKGPRPPTDAADQPDDVGCAPTPKKSWRWDGPRLQLDPDQIVLHFFYFCESSASTNLCSLISLQRPESSFVLLSAQLTAIEAGTRYDRLYREGGVVVLVCLDLLQRALCPTDVSPTVIPPAPPLVRVGGCPGLSAGPFRCRRALCRPGWRSRVLTKSLADQ